MMEQDENKKRRKNSEMTMSAGEDGFENLRAAFSFMNLPTEIRGQIYNLIPQTEVLQLRQVCQKWAEEIDNLFNFTMKLNDRNSAFPRQLELRITECEIIHFQKPLTRCPSSGLKLFKYPSVLRSLKIRETSAENIQLLLNCSEHLEELDITITCPVLSHIYSPSQPYKLDCLKSLRIHLELFEEDDSQINPLLINSENVIEKLLPLTVAMPNIHTLVLKLELYSVVQPLTYWSRFIGLTLSFIARHHKSLKNLEINFEDWYNDVEELAPSDLAMIDMGLLVKLNNLESLKLLTFSPSGVEPDLWRKLSGNQRKLSDLELNLRAIPIRDDLLFGEIVWQNEATLTSIRIHDIDFGKDNNRPFDMSLFKNCKHLKILYITQDNDLKIDPGLADLINVCQLPKSIETLHIEYYDILTDELIALLSSNLRNHLKRLVLVWSGSSGDFGVNGNVMQRLIHYCHNLVSFRVDRFNTEEEEEVLILESMEFFVEGTGGRYQICGDLDVEMGEWEFCAETFEWGMD